MNFRSRFWGCGIRGKTGQVSPVGGLPDLKRSGRLATADVENLSSTARPGKGCAHRGRGKFGLSKEKRWPARREVAEVVRHPPAIRLLKLRAAILVGKQAL
jgi:hypothetical protein